ncbi:hypothetical protein ENBRE01_0561 [Enteropsectra breve]|nr:hypothetical protein ENBRE01_0561 [Enteropsectra breve]
MLCLSRSGVASFVLMIATILSAGRKRTHEQSFSIARFPHESSEHYEVPRAFALKNSDHPINIKQHVIAIFDDLSCWRLAVGAKGFRLVGIDFETELISVDMSNGRRIIMASIATGEERIFRIARKRDEILLVRDLPDLMFYISDTPEQLEEEGYEEVKMKACSTRGLLLLGHSG